MKGPEKIASRLLEMPERRTFLKGVVGTAASAAMIPSIMMIASAHFPDKLDIEIEPDSEQNRIDPNSEGMVSVAVLQTTFENEDGEEGTFDPTKRPIRYRFGTDLLTEEDEARNPGSGARPVDDGNIRDVNRDGKDDLVLRFRIDDVGFCPDDSKGTLLWERPGTNEHGLHGTDDVSVVDQPSQTDVDETTDMKTSDNQSEKTERSGQTESRC